MAFKYSYLLPIIVPVWFILTFISTYLISVFNKDVYPVFPYISDTGTWSPESCIFGILLNIGAILEALIVYIRFRQVQNICEKHQFKTNIEKYNLYGSFLGYVASFGVCLVGNFQETNVLLVHILGASNAFGLGSIYLIIQTFISFKIFPILGTTKRNWTRFTLTLICSITFLLSGVFGIIAFFAFKGKDITKWHKEDGGYTEHIISAVTEWILAISTILYLSLYTNEFKEIHFLEPVIIEP